MNLRMPFVGYVFENCVNYGQTCPDPGSHHPIVETGQIQLGITYCDLTNFFFKFFFKFFISIFVKNQEFAILEAILWLKTLI